MNTNGPEPTVTQKTKGSSMRGMTDDPLRRWWGCIEWPREPIDSSAPFRVLPVQALPAGAGWVLGRIAEAIKRDTGPEDVYTLRQALNQLCAASCAVPALSSSSWGPRVKRTPVRRLHARERLRELQGRALQRVRS